MGPPMNANKKEITSLFQFCVFNFRSSAFIGGEAFFREWLEYNYRVINVWQASLADRHQVAFP
jgi:hypothetical protein